MTIIIVAMLIVCLLIATAVSISRAKNLPEEPAGESQTDPSGEQTSEPTEEQTSGPAGEQTSESVEQEEISGLVYVEYTKEAHPGTGIAYKGSGENAKTVIVIDAGHQEHAMSETEPNGPGASEQKPMVSGGTQGSVTGLAEYELNLRVALALRDVLVEKGYTVVMVRETNEVKISNAERAMLANLAGADVNLRIHANGDEDTSVKGAMSVCQTPQNPYNAEIYEQCRLLSDEVLQAFCQGTGISQRSVWETDTMTGTNWASVPTTILEMGFMTNAEDEAIMADAGFAAKAAVAIAAGIEAYLAQAPEKPTGPEGSSSEYEINYERERELGESFTEVYMAMEATATVWVRTEPSTEGGDDTKVHNIAMYEGKRVICIGLGQNWNRVLIDGHVYYISAAYLREATE